MSAEVFYVNDYACRSLGYTREELIGKHPWDFDPDFPPEALAAFNEEMTTKGIVQIESSHRRKDGTVFPVEVTATPIEFEGEDYVFIFVQDISERKRAERERELIITAIDKSQSAFYWLNPQGCVIYVNEYACRNLGMTREELTGLYVWDFDPDFDQSAWQPFWEDLRQRKTITIQSRHRRKDGTIFPIEATGNFINYHGEEHDFAFVQDISERKRAEKLNQRLSRLYQTLSETN